MQVVGFNKFFSGNIGLQVISEWEEGYSLLVHKLAVTIEQSMVLFLVEPNIKEPSSPCSPSPCGTNALCNEQNNAFSCVCPTNYVGDPFSSCRPECVLNTDCSREKSCVRNQCVDPCPGTCGLNAECRVSNHIPVCSCKESYTGDPYGSCRPIPTISKISVKSFPFLSFQDFAT